MWFRLSAFFIALFSSQLLWAVAINYPGDSLSQGAQYISTSTRVQDWHYSAEFVGNAKGEPIDELDRGFTSAHDKGYGFGTDITYLVGVTDRLNLGIRYGYLYEKADTKIDSTTGNNLEGEIVAEGGTDLTILGTYKIDANSTWDAEIQLPICSSSSVEDVCTSRPAAPANSQQAGKAGGQGNGYYGLKFGVSSNWLTVMDTHWTGSLYAQAIVSDNVFGEKVSAPFTFGGQFGAIMPIKPNHNWTLMLQVERMLEYSGYSEQLQTQVNYGQQSLVALNGQYLWDIMNRVQLKPFVNLAVRQKPSQSFFENDLKRRIDYSAGTLVTLGAQLSASF